VEVDPTSSEEAAVIGALTAGMVNALFGRRMAGRTRHLARVEQQLGQVVGQTRQSWPSSNRSA
jgi:hypothetical protein